MKSHIALLASPGMGHIIPILELGKRLSKHHNLHVTIFIISPDNNTSLHLLNSPNQANLDIVQLHSPAISILTNSNASIVDKILLIMRNSLPSLRSAISSMEFPPTALIFDIFGTESMKIADELCIFKYLFVGTNAWYVATSLFTPRADQNTLDQHCNLKLPLNIPGCKPLRFEDTVEPFLNRSDSMFDWFSRLGLEMSETHGILINTWEDLESQSLHALRDAKLFGDLCNKPVYPVGPLVRPVESKTDDVFMTWLENQPRQSVIYVSFGSGGTLSSKQMIELACGLELSGQRFIWVVRPPSDGNASGSYLTVDNESEKLSDYLPNGFLTRTRDIGRVVWMWAPQALILGHDSVGGFLSHCGWSSVLESIVNGMPMITWPLFAEQKMNAAILTDELGVAVRPETWPSEKVVERDEIERMVRRIMVDEEGGVIRNRAKQLKGSAIKASNEGGSSYNSLAQLALDCQRSYESLRVKGLGA